MGWFLDLFKKKAKDVVEQVIEKPVQNHGPIKDPNPPVLVANGGELPEAVVIGEAPKRYPAYYKKLHVILDNGHGENTPGKRSPDGKFREYAWAREIVAMLVPELEERGISYSVLVPETNDISLTERVKRANAIAKENADKKCILISIHCNAAGNGAEWLKARGWSGWTSKGQTESDALASFLYEAAHEVLDPKNIKIRTDKTDGDEDWESNFTIITKSSMPAVLTENFFQDNKSDVAYLNSKAGKKDVIDIHIKGIEKYADYKFKK